MRTRWIFYEEFSRDRSLEEAMAVDVARTITKVVPLLVQLVVRHHTMLVADRAGAEGVRVGATHRFQVRCVDRLTRDAAESCDRRSPCIAVLDGVQRRPSVGFVAGV